ncbi:hypothetical protein ABK040_000575 [Willaertia magna]
MIDTNNIAHLVGSTNDPLLTQDIYQLFENQVKLYGESEFIHVCPTEHSAGQDLSFSWNETYKRVNQVAKGLIKLGYKKGDRLGIWLPNSHEWIIVQLAAAKLGIIIVNVNPAYRKHELQHALNLVECKGIILVPEFKTTNYIKMMYDLCPELEHTPSNERFPEVDSNLLPHLKHIINCSVKQNVRYNGIINFDDILNFDNISLPKIPLDCHDVINIQFTSGTTGLPKSAALTHHNIANNGYFVGKRMNLTPDDKLCLPVPMYHTFGFVLGYLAFMINGASLVFPSFGFDAEASLKAVHTQKCTALHGVPTMFIAELEHPNFKKYDLSSLRTGIVAGSVCPMPLMKRILKELHMKDICNCYGMTETSPVSFQTLMNDSLEVRTSSVGRIHPHLEARVVDPETGKVLKFGEQGELQVKGYSVMKYYWNNPEATNKVIKDGWMCTGDIAAFRTDENGGYCSIEGRIKDIIIRGGENIVPKEIESFLYTNPNIKDVAIIGVPDQKYGEQVCACVILKDGKSMTEQELQEFCKDQIAHFKVPKYVLFTNEFPLTVSGKIQKYLLRDWATEKLGLKK